MNTKIMALVLLVSIAAADAFADRNPRRERRNDGNGQARADRHARAERNRSERPRAERTRPANRTERRRPETRRPETRPNRNRTADRVPERRRVERPNRPATRTERRRNETRQPETRRPNRPNRPVVTRPNRPSRPNRPVVSRPHRPSRNHYGTREYHRPYRYSRRAYRRYYHSPVSRRVVHTRRYTPSSYYRTLRSTYRNYIYLNWILHPSTRNNGYYSVNGYPYYIHNGYRHRYSWDDSCNYQLIDKNTHRVERTYWNQSCVSGYNRCAIDRDNRNEREWDNRYFCAETYRNQYYDFNTPTYDYQDDYYNDYDSNNSENCYDYDWETGVCYDY